MLLMGSRLALPNFVQCVVVIELNTQWTLGPTASYYKVGFPTRRVTRNLIRKAFFLERAETGSSPIQVASTGTWSYNIQQMVYRASGPDLKFTNGSLKLSSPCPHWSSSRSAFWVLISGPLVEHRSCLLIPTVQSNSSHSGGHLEMAWQRVNTSGHQTKEYNGL